MKPPFPFFGGKIRLASDIVATFPEHEHYIEPFAGSLSVLLAKGPSRMETINDLDGDLITFWTVLREQPDDLARICALTPHSRSEQDAAEAYLNAPSAGRPSVSQLELARLVWVQLSQGRAAVLRRTGWRHFVSPASQGPGMPGYLASYVDRMAAAAERISHVSLECRPALDLIAAYGRHPDNLLYVDPPYLGSARVRGNNYRHEMRTEDEHRELAEALLECRSAVVLSGYPSPLYDELYADWHRTSFAASTTQGGSQGGRTEVLWSNRGPDLGLFGEAS